MFCPNCGANNTTEQKYCRACGLNLEETALSLLAQIPSAESAALLRRQRQLEKFGNVAFGGFGIVLLAGIGTVIYLIVSKLIFSGQNVFGGILLVAFIIFAALSLAYVFFNEELKERRKKTNPLFEIGAEKKIETGKLLEARPFEPIGSVTENSTELFHAENKTRKFE